MKLDGLNPSNTFELRLLEALTSGEAIPVTITHEQGGGTSEDVVAALQMLADNAAQLRETLASVQADLDQIRADVAMHSQNFAMIIKESGG